MLLCSGCDLSAPRRPGPDGKGGDEAWDQLTPLQLCCQWGLGSVVQELIEHGANVNAKVITKYYKVKSRNVATFHPFKLKTGH